MYPVATYPRKRDELRELVIARRNVHLRLPDGRLALVGATDHILTIHVFEADMRREEEPQQSITVYRRDYPAIFDGKGWNLEGLAGFVGELLAQVPPRGENMDKSARLKLYAKMRAYRRAVGKPHRRRREGMGEACLLLRCAAIKQIVPCLDGETVKFFLLAAAYSDDLGVAFAGQREYWQYGYHPVKAKRYLELLDSVGLMRYVRKNQRDAVTRRQLPDAYQFNPELVYIRRAKRALAAELSQQPFMPLSKAGSENGEKPDQSFLSTSDPNQYKALTNTNNQKQEPSLGTTTTNPVGTRTPKTRIGAQGRKSDPAGKQLKQDSPQGNSAEGAMENQPRSAAAQSAPTPPYSPPAPPQGSAAYRAQLLNARDERMAQKLNALTGNMSMFTARYLVSKYGFDVCQAAVAVFTLQPVESLQNPGGFLRSLIERGATAHEDARPAAFADEFAASPY